MLTLSVLRCPDSVPPETKHVSGGEFSIGRGPANDWIIADPDRQISKKHCVVAFRNGGWAIADTSTNGTYLNRDANPLGTGQVRKLADGDRIRMGSYEIVVKIAEEQMNFGPGPGLGRAAPRDVFSDPFGDEPLAPRAAPVSTFSKDAFGSQDPLFGGAPNPQHAMQLPDDFDPLAPNPRDDFLSATQPDHTPAFADVFVPHRVVPPLPEDDDWDLGFGPPKPAAPPPAAPQSWEAPTPPAPPQPPPPQLPPAAPNPFVEERIAPPPPPQPVYAAPAAPDALLAAFLAGAGFGQAQPQNPEALMRALGAAFRATVSGIRQALIARASIKSEFRVEQTMIRARGNNPLKFSADDDDALAALLGLGRNVDVKPEAAIADALRDMRLHELATMAAMQQAVRALVAKLNPAQLREQAEQAGGLTLLPAQKKARAFEAYEKLHDSVTRALADDFDSVFGKAFARAYEATLQDISARQQ